MKNYFPTIIAFALMGFAAHAREGGAGRNRMMAQPASDLRVASSCTPASAQTDLDINNVRTTIYNGGDMWWDLTNSPRYEIPKGSRAHSSFASSLWIGGLDAGGQLKVAAQTYRQAGNDFFPGPLDNNASTDADICNQFNKIYEISRKEVEDFAAWCENPNLYIGYTVPNNIINWPGNGNVALGQLQFLAPFADHNNNGVYEWEQCEYPAFNLTGQANCSKNQLFGDQNLWWVFNDRGNIHTQTGGEAIGLEIRAQAFAFGTNDEINNMTFYTYQIINRSTVRLEETYFGQWVDSDLGFYLDDYVGCDVQRGLGYTYNGVSNDGGNPQPSLGTYGANPPAFGLDFFEGPLADAIDGEDNDRDGMTDETGEQIIMSKYVYYNNNESVIGEPQNATHYYNYLSGFWKDGTPITYGGNGYGGSQPANFMFPGSTDPQFSTTPWTEVTAGNTPDDRRMLTSAGPFTLEPGEVNYITVGAVWARAASGGPLASVELLRVTDDKAQTLFNSCFRTLEGPRAPDMDIQELDKEIVIYLKNSPSSNNYLGNFSTTDANIVAYHNLVTRYGGAGLDTTYNFEGYQIFQLKDETVSPTDVYDADKARLVAQCDVRNGIAQLVNRTLDASLGMEVPMDMTLQADDKGIQHSFSIREDAFASGDRRLVNHKTYYYTVRAYAQNEYLKYLEESFDTLNPNKPSNIGQKKPYLAGRGNIVKYTAIPHIPSPELGGTFQSSQYGSGPEITRVEGCGNGNQVIDLTPASELAILNAATVNNGGTSRADMITYAAGRGPVNIKVIDPLNVPEGDFELRLINNPYSKYTVTDTARWELRQTTPVNRVVAVSDRAISMASIFANEQLIPDLGLSITVSQVQNPGWQFNPDKNGVLEANITFSDETKRWLSGVKDRDGQQPGNWIRSGTVRGDTTDPCRIFWDDERQFQYGGTWFDEQQEFEKLIDGTWAPYRMCALNPSPSATTICNPAGPALNNAVSLSANKLENIASVDIVFTNDKSKWTRVPVFESGPVKQMNLGQREAFTLRNSPSVDKQGTQNNAAEANLISSTGMGWFPGYAINVETGERLNMAFSENTGLAAENGRDMLWNPSANEMTQFNNVLWGGMHYLYVFGHNGNAVFSGIDPSLDGRLRDIPAYDMGKTMIDIMQSPLANTYRREIWADAMWVSIPMLDRDYAAHNWNYNGSPLPCDARVRLRVAKPYKRFYNGMNPAGGNVIMATDSAGTATPVQNRNNPMYTFNTRNLKVATQNQNAAVNALDLINVVPNPYYAYSGYEKNQLDNRVKITNLPDKCRIRIYTVSGTLVRTYTKDDSQITSLDWDLKNQAGIPLASGLYIIHVEVPGVGEKILKWFGVMRPLDLDAY
ncbi:MAG: T9SS type A sorting domain-containing protein [Bacteroidia bacterium]|jgi:hypothetical protein|nr:T9SS type A sorting domain-containing protein [Bacteroidia bacterium]